MIDTIIILGILAIAGIAFNIQNRRAIADKRGNGNPDKSEEDPEIRHTIDLIGKGAYKEMTERIERIMKEHSGHKNCRLSLTCGPDTFDGAHELHSLLPGQPVKLLHCRAEGVETIDVYYNGVRIGRLALNEARHLLSLLEHNSIIAAYVAEQNCYRKIGSHQMDIIVFYKQREKEKKDYHKIYSDIKIFKNRKEATKYICLN